VAASLGDVEWFDGSLLGVRKFTTTELLDQGFDISNVAQRQGHSPIVVARTYYSKNRRSADRRATEVGLRAGRTLTTSLVRAVFVVVLPVPLPLVATVSGGRRRGVLGWIGEASDGCWWRS
jgi:hypothetical protein